MREITEDEIFEAHKYAAGEDQNGECLLSALAVFDWIKDNGFKIVKAENISRPTGGGSTSCCSRNGGGGGGSPYYEGGSKGTELIKYDQTGIQINDKRNEILDQLSALDQELGLS